MDDSRSNNNSNKRQKGFTFIEIVMIIIILGIIASVAAPMYKDIGLEAKKNSLRGSLFSMREALSTWASNQAVNGAGFNWPVLVILSTPGEVMMQRIPPNPFQPNAPDSIVAGVTKGQVYGTRGGWAYNETTGEIWANTSSTVAGSGCSGSQTLNENTW